MDRLTVEVIDDVEGAKAPAAVERIVHEVRRPDLIGPLRHPQGTPFAFRQPPLGPALLIEVYGPIHPVNPFVIPAIAPTARDLEALPKATARAFVDQPVQGVDYLGITLLPGRPPQRGKPPPIGARTASELLFNQVLERPILQCHIRIHALHLRQLVLHLYQALELRGVHPAKFGFPVVVGGRADAVLAAELFLIGTPASASFRIAMICVSENFDFFILTSRLDCARRFYFLPVYQEGKLTPRPLGPTSVVG